MFRYRFDRNLPIVCPIGGTASDAGAILGPIWRLPGVYLAADRTVSAGFVTPSRPVSIRTVKSAFCGPYQAFTGLYHSLRECQLPPSPPPPKRHRDIRIGGRAGKGHARCPGD